MARVIVTLKLMPESPEINLDSLLESAKEVLVEHNFDFISHEIKPIAFGLKQLNIIFAVDESKGSVDFIEDECAKIDGVNSAEIIDVRREVEKKDVIF